MYTFKKDIITISKDTIVFFKDKNTLRTKHLKLQFNKSENYRLGIIIPKKLLPLSVRRNALRRKIRGYFRNLNRPESSHEILLSLTSKIQAEKKIINDILMREWKSLLNQLL